MASEIWNWVARVCYLGYVSSLYQHPSWNQCVGFYLELNRKNSVPNSTSKHFSVPNSAHFILSLSTSWIIAITIHYPFTYKLFRQRFPFFFFFLSVFSFFYLLFYPVNSRRKSITFQCAEFSVVRLLSFARVLGTPFE